MKREILFKGQHKESLHWVYGDLNQNDVHNGISIRTNGVIITAIVPGTQCQYTEINDKSKNKIFDCDKVKAYFPEGWYGEVCTLDEDTTLELVVEWSDGWFLVDPYDSDKHFWMGSLDSLNVQLEVIGNTHNNR